MEWTTAQIAGLRALWDEGHSTSEIGRRMGVSKNAIVGKAHRLDLPARESPIRPLGSGARPRQAAKRAGKTTLPPLGSVSPAERTAGGRTPQPTSHKKPGPTRRPPRKPPPKAAQAKRVKAPVQAPAPAPAPAASALLPAGQLCCWPIGEPGSRDFRFCGATAKPGKPYCEQHCGLAYQKVVDLREQTA